MQKDYKEKYLKSYAIKSINSKGRIYNEKDNYLRSQEQLLQVKNLSIENLKNFNQ